MTKNKEVRGDFLDGPVVKTPCFHCRGGWVQSLVGELRSRMPHVAKKQKKKKMQKLRTFRNLGKDW